MDTAAAWKLARHKITHVIYLVKENRTFDTLFGRFPGAKGTTHGTLCDGTRIPLADATYDTAGASHSFIATIEAINGGRMNCFDAIPQGENAATYVQYSEDQIPNYWTYAERFVRSIKEECLDRIVPIGERHFRRAVSDFVAVTFINVDGFGRVKGRGRAASPPSERQRDPKPDRTRCLEAAVQQEARVARELLFLDQALGVGALEEERLLVDDDELPGEEFLREVVGGRSLVEHVRHVRAEPETRPGPEAQVVPDMEIEP